MPPKSKKPKRPKKRAWKELDSEQWWEMHITFPAKSKHAMWFFDHLDTTLICQGTGKGKKHRCRRPFVASMRPIDLEDDE